MVGIYWRPPQLCRGTVYVIAASIVFDDLGNAAKILAFGLGFAIGTANGIYSAQKLGVGSVTLRLFKSGDAEPQIQGLRESGYSLTSTQGAGRDGHVAIIQIIFAQACGHAALEIAKPRLNGCFVSVGDEPVVASSQCHHRRRARHHLGALGDAAATGMMTPRRGTHRPCASTRVRACSFLSP
jgi:hypothetical protein